MSKTIDNEKELRDFINSNMKAAVMFGKKDCIHCTIAKKCIEEVEESFPDIGFCITEERELSEMRHINAFPVIVLYKNGTEQGRLCGTDNIAYLKNILSLMTIKETNPR